MTQPTVSKQHNPDTPVPVSSVQEHTQTPRYWGAQIRAGRMQTTKQFGSSSTDKPGLKMMLGPPHKGWNPIILMLLFGQNKANRWIHTDITWVARTSTSIIPTSFLHWMPFIPQPPNLSRLATATELCRIITRHVALFYQPEKSISKHAH